MTDYTTLPPEERFTHLERMAANYFGKTWKGKFADRYGLNRTSISAWKTGSRTTPIWALVAMRDALVAQKAEALAEMMKEKA